MPPDYYKILGISHSANLEEIKQAAKTKGIKIKTAFAVLSQAETRTAYDAKLDLGPHNHYATLAVSREANRAQIKIAAQARMKEIKEAYETLSKPDTRKAYDFQLQPAKPTTPVAPEKLSKPATRTTSDSHFQPLKPSTPVAPSPPKRENVVVEPKPVSPSDRDKSQVSRYLSPPISLANADRHTEEIELADRGTRLKAVLYDVLIILMSIVFATNKAQEQLIYIEFEVTYFLVLVIGIIMTNLVLLYRHGQTIGKHIYSIKIINTDGSRAGLGILLVRTLVAIGTPLLVAILLIRWANSPGGPLIAIINIIALIALLDTLFIVQDSQRCLHDLMAKTIVVKVFPGEAAAPVLIEHPKGLPEAMARSALRTIVSKFIPLLGRGIFDRVWPVPIEVEIPPATRVRQGPPASKATLLRLTLLLGWLGAHHFYLGRYGRGTIHLLLFWTMFPLWFALIELWMFSVTSSDFIENNYTADKSMVAFVLIPPVPVIFIVFLVLAQWTAYTDDLKRGKMSEAVKVSEAVKLLNGLKTPAEQYMATKGQFPSMIEEMTDKTSGNDIATLTSNPEEFYFEATMNQQDSVLTDKVVRLIFHRESKTWRCRTPFSNGIPPEYLPTGCNLSTAEIIANNDYLKREKVSKAIQLLEELKKPAEQYMAAKGEFPPTITLLTNRTSGKYIANLVSNSEHFYLEATMSKEDTVLGGKSVRLIYHPDTKTWGCSAAYLNGIAQKYLPSNCK